MEIAWFGIPAYGHTNPSLGIVKEMTDVGHEVYYFSFDIFKENLYLNCIEAFKATDYQVIISMGANKKYFEVPLVLVPQTPEQGEVATRVEELGAGIILKWIGKEEILNVINEVLDNPKYKENALKISESFKGCGGAKEARIFLETIVGIVG